METPSLSPYIMFDGNCREAMEFYKSVLGGELTMSTYGESGDPSTPEAEKDRIMHATLENGTASFMASDTSDESPKTSGSNIRLSLAGTDVDGLTTVFNKLAEGGTVLFPLEKQMWGALFGMLTDKYGISWMVNINLGDAK